MALKHNAIDHATNFANALEVVNEYFYVDDCLTGANSITEAFELQSELHSFFLKGGFVL